MPIYEYQCQDCGARSEQLMKISDPDPAQCPACGRPGLKRLLSAPAFRLAGSGWYETDFKTDQDKKRNLVGEAKTESVQSAQSDDAKIAQKETKPAASAESKPAEAPKAVAKPTAD